MLCRVVRHLFLPKSLLINAGLRLQSNSPILKSTLPKYATYQAALDEWRQYCESQHEHPADFINGTAYSPHTSQITRPSAATPRTLTDHQERVVLSPPPTTSLSGVSTLSDASDSSDNLVGPKAKERCWAIHTPEGLINEIVTGYIVLLIKFLAGIEFLLLQTLG